MCMMAGDVYLKVEESSIMTSLLSAESDLYNRATKVADRSLTTFPSQKHHENEVEKSNLQRRKYDE